MEQRKRRHDDRKDAFRVRDLDAMHAFIPYMLPNRADNEAVMTETVDLSAVNEYLERKNADKPEFKYTLFHVVNAAIAKTVALRPRMNRFIAGHRMYERNDIILSFVVKKQFTDEAYEALAIITVDKDDSSPLEQIYGKVKKFVYSVRKDDKTDGTTDKIGVLNKLPRWVLRIVIGALRLMEYYGKLPQALVKDDPYHTTAFISNLGSIKMSASYHHLTNWGTNSFFVIIGEKYKKPFFNDDGTFELREVVDLSMTLDERIADGTYYARSCKLLRTLLNNPDLLDQPILEPVKGFE